MNRSVRESVGQKTYDYESEFFIANQSLFLFKR